MTINHNEARWIIVYEPNRYTTNTDGVNMCIGDVLSRPKMRPLTITWLEFTLTTPKKHIYNKIYKTHSY